MILDSECLNILSEIIFSDKSESEIEKLFSLYVNQLDWVYTRNVSMDEIKEDDNSEEVNKLIKQKLISTINTLLINIMKDGKLKEILINFTSSSNINKINQCLQRNKIAEYRIVNQFNRYLILKVNYEILN